jgi:hypothetical protein
MPQLGDLLQTDGRAKGRGFFGPLTRPDGRVSTELSIGVSLDGQEVQIPLLVPTLTRAEVQKLLSGTTASQSVVNKAVQFYRARRAAGQPAFAQPGEEQSVGWDIRRPMPSQGDRLRPIPSHVSRRVARPGEHYDYNAAISAGYGPDASGHWPSEFKGEAHPNLVVGGFNTKTGKRVPGTRRARGEELVLLGWSPDTVRTLDAIPEPNVRPIPSHERRR